MDYILNEEYQFEFAGQIKSGIYIDKKTLFDNTQVYMMHCLENGKIYPVKKIEKKNDSKTC